MVQKRQRVDDSLMIVAVVSIIAIILLVTSVSNDSMISSSTEEKNVLSGLKSKRMVQKEHDTKKEYNPVILKENKVKVDCAPGDMNGDGVHNIIDIVGLSNCVLGDSCGEIDNGCAADMNGDQEFNILDIVSLVSCVLTYSC